MRTLGEILTRGWDNFTARPGGGLSLRFVIQPTVAAVIAVRAGLRDARSGAPPYLWAALTSGAERRALVEGGWKDIRMPFLVALTVDAIYQTITHQAIYLVELLLTATLLAVVPYLVLRGPVNRLARILSRRKGES